MLDDCACVRLCVLLQNKQSEFCAPLTSFDWNDVDPKRLGTSSIDTTCTIWVRRTKFVQNCKLQ